MHAEVSLGVQLDDHGNGRFSLSGYATFQNIGPLLFAGRKLFVGRNEVTINLADASIASTAGLALLMEWSSWCSSQGVCLVFEKPKKNVVELIVANDVEDMLSITE